MYGSPVQFTESTMLLKGRNRKFAKVAVIACELVR